MERKCISRTKTQLNLQKTAIVKKSLKNSEKTAFKLVYLTNLTN